MDSPDCASPGTPDATATVTRSTSISAERRRRSSRKSHQSSSSLREDAEPRHTDSVEGTENAAPTASSRPREVAGKDVEAGQSIIADVEQGQETTEGVVGEAPARLACQRRTGLVKVNTILAEKHVENHSVQGTEKERWSGEVSDKNSDGQENQDCVGLPVRSTAWIEKELVPDFSEESNSNKAHLAAAEPQLVLEEDEDDFEVIDTSQTTHLTVSHMAWRPSTEKSSTFKQRPRSSRIFKRWSSGSDSIRPTKDSQHDPESQAEVISMASEAGEKSVPQSSHRKQPTKPKPRSSVVTSRHTSSSSKTGKPAKKKRSGKAQSGRLSLLSQTKSKEEGKLFANQEPLSTNTSCRKSASGHPEKVSSRPKLEHLNTKKASALTSPSKSKGKNKSAKQEQTMKPLRKSSRKRSEINYKEGSTGPSDLQSQDRDYGTPSPAKSTGSKRLIKRKLEMPDITVDDSSREAGEAWEDEDDGKALRDFQHGATGCAGLLEDTATDGTVAKGQKQPKSSRKNLFGKKQKQKISKKSDEINENFSPENPDRRKKARVGESASPQTLVIAAPRERSLRSQGHTSTDMKRKSSSMEVSVLQKTAHFCEVTNSQTPPVFSSSHKGVQIVHPEPSEGPGLRRSKRNRVRPLEWFRGERPVYEKRKSGWVMSGVTMPTITEDDRARLLKSGRLKVNKAKKRKKAAKPHTQYNLSMHDAVPENCDITDSSQIPVINPVTQEEVLVECVRPRSCFQYVGLTGEEAQESDPLILAKMMRQKAFSVGMLVLRPLQEKDTQFVRNDTMIFIVKYGKLAVTIHKQCSILETDDTFFVPKGNTYSVRNLRDEEAKLWFFQLKG